MENMHKRLVLLAIMICIMILLMPSAALAADNYSDIANHWNKAAIESWIDKGYVSGYADGTFKPDQYITRAEFMILVNKAFEFSNTAPIDYSDVKSDAWYANAVSRAKAAGYISGYPDGTIKPDSPISREEAASIIIRLKNLARDEAAVNEFTDSINITWSKGAVGAIAKAGIMKGYPDGTFLPRKNITRAEAVAALNKALGSPAGALVVPISISAIKGVTVPVKGEEPVSELDPAEEYTAEVLWQPADEVFAANTVYTAVIEITPKSGYTLKGVPANFFTVAGAETANAADSGVVTAVFPRTEASSGGGGGGGSSTSPVFIGSISNISIIESVTTTAAIVTSPSDAVVSAVSSDINVAVVSVIDHELTITGVAAGTSTITVTAAKSGFDNGTRSFSISVIPREVTGIAVKAQPAKITYYTGQSLDLTGLVVTLTYNDTTSEDIALTDFAAYEISVSPDSGTVLAITDTEVTITVNGKATKQLITVNPITLTADTTLNDVDHVIDITFGAGAAYANAITGVSFNGMALTVNTDYTVSSDKVSLKPAGGNSALRTPATANVVIEAAGYGDACVLQTITAGTANSIAVTTHAVPGADRQYFATQPVITIYDKYGNTCADGTSSGASVYADRLNGVPGQWNMYGTMRQYAAAGVAAFDDLQCWVSSPGTGSIRFELEGTPYIAHSSFNLPDIEITGFKPIADVDAGTAGYPDYEDASAIQAVLPTIVTANPNNLNIPVAEWVDTDSYDPALAGSYTFTAILGTIPAGYANSGGFSAAAEVVVSPAADLTEYLAALNAVHEEDYTTSSWAEYQAVVNANVVTARNKQSEVDTATANISAAQADLIVRSVMGGTLSITGTAKYGETLQADITGITYIPVTSDDVPSYQWKRDGEDIAGETDNSYIITEADIGKAISVTVSADGDHAAGSINSTVTSVVDKADGPAAPESPTAAIITTTSITLAADPLHEFSRTGGASWQDSEVFSGLTPSTDYTFLARVKETATHKASAASAGNLITTNDPSLMSGSVVITGIEKFGGELGADTSGISFDPPTSDNVFSYQWYRDGSPINGETESNYMLTAADIGQTLTVTISADGLHAVGSITSTATGIIAKADGPAAPEQDIRATYPVETNMIDLKNLAARAAGLEAAIAIDGMNFDSYLDLSVSASGDVRITGLTDVSTSSVVKIRVKETATVLAGEDKTIAVTEAGIRDRGPTGGFIFYDKGSYSDGWRYIEAAGVNAGSSTYCNVDYMPTGGFDTAIGTGRSNTEDIISRTSQSAAKMCDDWSWGGKDDWFLPSKDELAAMCSNLHRYGLGGFDNYWYWSSSEYIDSYGTVRPDLAWVIQFSDSSASAFKKTIYPWRVRAARYL